MSCIDAVFWMLQFLDKEGPRDSSSCTWLYSQLFPLCGEGLGTSPHLSPIPGLHGRSVFLFLRVLGMSLVHTDAHSHNILLFSQSSHLESPFNRFAVLQATILGVVFLLATAVIIVSVEKMRHSFLLGAIKPVVNQQSQSFLFYCRHFTVWRTFM